MNQPLNREQKRLMQRKGALAADGAPAPAEPRQRASRAPGRERVSPGQFVREVRSEIGKVAWPSRAETVNYSVVVLITLAVLMAIIFVLDYGAAKSALFLFK